VGEPENDPLLQGVNSLVPYHGIQAWIVALQLIRILEELTLQKEGLFAGEGKLMLR